MTKKSRIAWIDLARAFAIVCAVLCHTTENTFFLELDYMLSIRTVYRIAAFTEFTIGRLGVPIFLMISGYLLIDKEYDTEKTLLFWKKNWLRLFIVTEIWFIIYELFILFIKKETISLKIICLDLLFVHGVGLSHIWYMPMILGIYVLIPFVANGLRSIPPKLLIFPILIFSVAAFGYPLLMLLNGMFRWNLPLYNYFSLGFSGGVYGLYLVFGFVIKKDFFKKVSSGKMLTFAVVSLVLAVFLMEYSYQCYYQWNMWYDNVFLAFSAVCLFELLSRVKYVKAYDKINFLAEYSFAVYLIHNILISASVGVYNDWSVNPLIRSVLFPIIILSASLLIAWIIGKIPKAGKYLLYIK